MVRTEYIRPLITHKEALQCVLRSVTRNSAHQPQFMGEVFYVIVLRHNGLQIWRQGKRKKSVNIFSVNKGL
jgi:hypothetical protein